MGAALGEGDRDGAADPFGTAGHEDNSAVERHGFGAGRWKRLGAWSSRIALLEAIGRFVDGFGQIFQRVAPPDGDALREITRPDGFKDALDAVDGPDHAGALPDAG